MMIPRIEGFIKNCSENILTRSINSCQFNWDFSEFGKDASNIRFEAAHVTVAWAALNETVLLKVKRRWWRLSVGSPKMG